MEIPLSNFILIYNNNFYAYRGVGSAYAVIAKYGNYSAAYIPIFSYGCDPVFNEESCCFLNSTMTKVICTIVFCCGVLLIVGKNFLNEPMNGHQCSLEKFSQLYSIMCC